MHRSLQDAWVVSLVGAPRVATCASEIQYLCEVGLQRISKCLLHLLCRMKPNDFEEFKRVDPETI